MGASRKPGGRRVLLPAEANLINTVGLTEEEYWHFVALTDAYNGKRKEGYELVPDINNDVVTVVVSLVVGLALSAISAAIAPKPKAPKIPKQQQRKEEESGANIQGESISGRSRFAPQSSFDSVQELANLGSVIPLIFARKGVRVQSSMLWSQMLSKGIGQQLRVIAMFGSGEIEGRPDWASYGIGGSLLENYIGAKVALYFANDGGRFKESSPERYIEGTGANVPTTDAFSIAWAPSDGEFEPYFSGTRTPSTSTQFGVYSPMPNGTKFLLNFEWQPGLKNESAESVSIKHTKNVKHGTAYSWGVGVISSDKTGAVIRIGNSNSYAPSAFAPHGVDDINNATEQERIVVDENLAIGAEYLVGTEIGVATAKTTTEPWELGITQDCFFRWTEKPGIVDITHPYGQAPSYSPLLVQRVAVGTVSSNRACDATEIGFKSTVYKQINGYSNVNSFIGYNQLSQMGQGGGSVTLGSMQTYISRLSFFVLEVRPLGSKAPWENISDGTVFCVRGRSPIAQYNYIRIHHPRGQYEFRLKPYAGNAVLRYLFNKDVYLLRAGDLMSYPVGKYSVEFAGRRLKITNSVTSNDEWILGTPPPKPLGRVTGVNYYAKGRPAYYKWNETGEVNGWIVFEYRRPFGGITNWVLYNNSRNIVASGDGSFNGYTTGNTRYKKGNSSGGNIYGSRYKVKKDIRVPDAGAVRFRKQVTASGGSGSGLVFNVVGYGGGYVTWAIAAVGLGYKSGQTVYIPSANVSVRINAEDEASYSVNSYNPHDAITDGITFQEESSSHLDGPEHEITYVNEFIAQEAPNYTGLCMAGLRLDSSKEWSSFSSLSAFFKRGTMVERLAKPGRGASNLLPEIAYALLTDPKIGAGNLIGANQVDRDRMKEAALFCQANDFTWDGIIDSKLNLREWIFEQAGYCLLDFTILGGRFSLVPSVPVNSDWTINYEGKPEIKALFTDGNIKGLKVSFLTPEERQMFRGVATWREDTINGFPETKTVALRLSNEAGGSDEDPEETFGLEGFCTSEEHATTFLRYALKLRKVVDHGLSFQTTPQAAMSLVPGDYFRLVSEVTHTSRFSNGTIGADGTIQSVDEMTNGKYSILYWKPGTEGVKEAQLTVTGGKAQNTDLRNTVFTLNNSTTVDRTYKLESLTYGEEGLVEVSASYAPLTERGTLAVLDWNLEDFVNDSL